QGQSKMITDLASAVVLKRFEFVKCSFVLISIDENFLDLFEKITLTPSCTSLKIWDCTFGESLSDTSRKKFAPLLLSVKPTRLYMDCDPQSIVDVVVDDNFLQRIRSSCGLSGADYHQRKSSAISSKCTVCRHLIEIRRTLHALSSCELNLADCSTIG
ncbi:hypothetical protein PENTCL1PPCAC_4234, partial [Pristionchus entomophagus]